MKNLLKRVWGWGPAVLLPVVLALGFLFPGISQAAKQITIGDHVGEGDPIDGNDFGTDGGGSNGDDLHSDLGIESVFSWTLPMLMDGARIIVIPDLRSGSVFFQVIIIEDTRSFAEGIDAR